MWEISLPRLGIGSVLLFLLLISIWNSRGVSGDACSPVQDNSEKGVRAEAGGVEGVVSRREAVHASSADTFPVHFPGGRGERSRLTCNPHRSLLWLEPFLGKSQTFPRQPWLEQDRRGSCEEAQDLAGASRDVIWGFVISVSQQIRTVQFMV